MIIVYMHKIILLVILFLLINIYMQNSSYRKHYYEMPGPTMQGPPMLSGYANGPVMNSPNLLSAAQLIGVPDMIGGSRRNQLKGENMIRGEAVVDLPKTGVVINTSLINDGTGTQGTTNNIYNPIGSMKPNIPVNTQTPNSEYPTPSYGPDNMIHYNNQMSHYSRMRRRY